MSECSSPVPNSFQSGGELGWGLQRPVLSLTHALSLGLRAIGACRKVLGSSSSSRTGAGGEGAYKHWAMGKGMAAPRAAAAARKQLGPHCCTLALGIGPACHAKGLPGFAASWGKYSSGAEQKQSLRDPRSLNPQRAKIDLQ